jgi:RNA polymerase sigma-70 factor (ECF subfamily)
MRKTCGYLPKDSLYTEPELMLLISKGDPYAFRQLFTAYSPQVYTFCVKLTKDAELARDLTQEIFARLWTRRERLTEVRSFKRYLTTMALNLIRNYLQKKVLKPVHKEDILGYFRDNALLPDREMEFKELELALQEAVNHLPPQLNRSFVLSRMAGMSHSEIASQMQLSPLTVKSHIARSLAFIRAYVAEHHPTLLTALFLYFFSHFL